MLRSSSGACAFSAARAAGPRVLLAGAYAQRQSVRCISSSLSARALHTSLPVAQQKKGGKGGAAAAGPAFEEKFDLAKQIPVNLLKEGSDPEYLSDDQYPPWLFKLLEEKPLLEDFIMKGLEKVPREDMKMVFRMANKKRIKEANDARRKNIRNARCGWSQGTETSDTDVW